MSGGVLNRMRFYYVINIIVRCCTICTPPSPNRPVRTKAPTRLNSSRNSPRTKTRRISSILAIGSWGFPNPPATSSLWLPTTKTTRFLRNWTRLLSPLVARSLAQTSSTFPSRRVKSRLVRIIPKFTVVIRRGEKRCVRKVVWETWNWPLLLHLNSRTFLPNRWARPLSIARWKTTNWNSSKRWARKRNNSLHKSIRLYQSTNFVWGKSWEVVVSGTSIWLRRSTPARYGLWRWWTSRRLERPTWWTRFFGRLNCKFTWTIPTSSNSMASSTMPRTSISSLSTVPSVFSKIFALRYFP